MPFLKLKPALRPVPSIVPFIAPIETEEATLRSYQEDAKREVYKLFKEGVMSVLLILTGGLGKTRLAA